MSGAALATHGCDESGPSGEVPVHPCIPEPPMGCDALEDPITLIDPHFERQQAASPETARCFRDERVDHRHPVRPGEEGPVGLVLEYLRSQGIPFRLPNVRRIGHDGIYPHSGRKCVEPLSEDQAHRAGVLPALEILPGQREGRLGSIHGPDGRERAFGRKRQGDAPRAGSQVHGVEILPPHGPLQDAVHQELGLGPGDQRPGVAPQVELPEGGPAQDVLEGLPAGPASEERLEGLPLLGREGPVELEVELEAFHAQCVGQEVLSIARASV